MSASVNPTTSDPTTLTNQTQVQISVQGHTLSVYPQRAQDVVVYHVAKDRSSDASPSKPHEVRWVVNGMNANQELAIEAVPNQVFAVQGVLTAKLLPGGAVELMRVAGTGVHTRRSGVPTDPGPGHGREQSWKYDIVLYEDRQEVARLDPVVIIKEDP